MMVILNANDGKIITSLPLAGGSDGAVFNPATMEAFSSHGNGTMTIVKEKQPDQLRGGTESADHGRRKTLTLGSKTNHILTMAAEYGPPAPPATPPPGGAPPQGRGGRGPARGPMLPDTFSILVVA